jgi:release factor glutamine methyltransferase
LSADWKRLDGLKNGQKDKLKSGQNQSHTEFLNDSRIYVSDVEFWCFNHGTFDFPLSYLKMSAYQRHIHKLLKATGNEKSATNELRWMMEVILEKRQGISQASSSPIDLYGRNLPKILSEFNSRESRILDRWVVDRTERHKPLQYILGYTDFCGLQIRLRPPTLIPRWETEEWTSDLVSNLASIINKEKLSSLKVLDICTGTGCIALSLASHLSHIPNFSVKVHGWDISQQALLLARLNQRKLQIPTDVLQFHSLNVFDDKQVNEFESMAGKFDLIVSNPPYISLDDMKTLDPDVLHWEDHKALIAENGGLEFYSRILSLHSRLLTTAPVSKALPRFVFEIGGAHQKPGLERLLNGTRKHEFKEDMSGNLRTLTVYS